MSTLGISGLVLAYVALAVLLLSLHLFSNWKWWIKAGATVILMVFYYVTYTSVPTLLGWPTPYDIPAKFRLIAFSVDEGKGIFIWANDLRNGVRLSTPRSYLLPYSKTLHTSVEIAGAKIRRGGAIIGEINQTPAAGGKPQDGEQSTQQSKKVVVTFIDAPEALIPDKK